MAFLAPLVATAGAATATATAIGAGFQAASARKERKSAKSLRLGQTRKTAIEAEAAKKKREKKAGLAKTKGGTLLTGGQGVLEQAQVSRKKLLGE